MKHLVLIAEVQHRLWLIYGQLKEAETDAEQRLALLEQSRDELGQILNCINRSHATTLEQLFPTGQK